MNWREGGGAPRPGESGSTDGDAARLRVLIVTADDPIYVSRFFEALIPAVPDTVQVVGVTVLPAFGEPMFRTVRRVFLLYGWMDFARLCLRYAWARIRGRSVARLVGKAGIPLVETRSVNGKDYLCRVELLAPDAIVSVAAPEVFKGALLSLPRLGCLNVHSGRLPAYRGMMPVFWQLLAGEPAATVTVHRMVERIDGGPVLDVVEVPLEKRDRLGRALVAAKRAGAGLLVDVLDRLRRGSVKSRDDIPGDDCYRSFPRPEDVRAFRKRGHRMF